MAAVTVRWVDTRLAVDASSLTDEEQARVARLRRPEDRAARRAATALLREVVAARTGTTPGEVVVDRTCERCGAPHGRPRVPGTGLEVSVTHSGYVAGVAVGVGAPVGLDVEDAGRFATTDVAAEVLGAGERAAGPDDLARYWVRKEAVVKATGEGLAAGLREVLVSGPTEPARLRAYPRRPDLRAGLVDLAVPSPYVACLAVLSTEAVEVSVGWSGDAS